MNVLTSSGIVLSRWHLRGVCCHFLGVGKGDGGAFDEQQSGLSASRRLVRVGLDQAP
jgi:hypothetical protein